MKIGYARVSTNDQNMDLQIDALKSAGCNKIFSDHGVSGAINHRDGLTEALKCIAKGDFLVVWKLDRLGRSLKFLCQCIEDLSSKDIGFVCLTDGIDTSTAGGKLMFHMMGALAEFERSLISERTRAGMQAAKNKGIHIGRPRLLNTADWELIENELTLGQTKVSLAKKFGVSINTMVRFIQKNSEITPIAVV